MDAGVIFAIGGCFLCGSVTYVVLDYYRHGERQAAIENVLSVQAKVQSGQKTLQGYTKFTEYLGAAKQAALEKSKTQYSKSVREYVHIEKLPNLAQGPKSESTVIVKYVVEYVIGFELKPDNFEILATTAGIDLKLRRPTLIGTPFIKTSSHDGPIGGSLENEKESIKAIYDKLPGLVQQHSLTITAEEPIRALCEKKLLLQVSSFLAVQSGVTQVPTISVVYT